MNPLWLLVIIPFSIAIGCVVMLFFVNHRINEMLERIDKLNCREVTDRMNLEEKRRLHNLLKRNDKLGLTP